jgi:hypothetical protein
LTYLDQSSSHQDLLSALSLLEERCLTEPVITGKKWQNSIYRFRGLQDKIKDAIQERIQSDYKLTKMLIKSSQRILKEGGS